MKGYWLGASAAPPLLEKGGYEGFLFCLLVVQLLYAFFCMPNISQKQILKKEEYVIFQIVKGSVIYGKNCKEIY